jgi:adenylylsulfate kinase-like enzyme
MYLDTPLSECEQRDPKGLYAKARLGELMDFTCIDSPYEAPISPDIKIDTTKVTCDEAIRMIIDRVEKHLC